MSKNSAKQHYTQLTEWLTVRKQGNTTSSSQISKPTRFSKADTYNKSRR